MLCSVQHHSLTSFLPLFFLLFLSFLATPKASFLVQLKDWKLCAAVHKKKNNLFKKTLQSDLAFSAHI
jgi:hypothetical protein